MDLLLYSDLDYNRVSRQFLKVADQLKQLEFNAADVKKMPDSGFYRAKLDYENRLLFKFAKYQDKTYLLLLEIIYNHDYQSSRFLRGASINESKFIPINTFSSVTESDAEELTYVNPSQNKFHLLDKVISFDENQEDIFKLKPPIIIVGSAGSGKTVLTLEKLKTLKGRVLYVTLSAFLTENAANLYYANNYENTKQEIDFLSFHDFCSTIKILDGTEMDQRRFDEWLKTRSHVFGIRDIHQLFEEFRGVLTGMDVEKPYLSRQDYLDLGVKQSIFLGSERNTVYDVFEKYLEYLNDNHLYDLNIISHQYLSLTQPKYDFVVVDEMQDFTNIQLFLILKTLNEKGSFILCGDSNQIVHPNFFSWTNVKSMFYKQEMTNHDVSVLQANYRNSPAITNTANRLLKVKHARFGSLDKESNFLIKAIGNDSGEINLMNDDHKTRRMLNEKTSLSARYAVLVMRQEDKNAARQFFKTPLLFSIHESKGLEYENVILLNFVTNNSREFDEIVKSVNTEDVENDDLTYSRQRDKTDKSVETFKFYINSLYVGITRGIKNIYLIEANQKHRLWQLLNLAENKKEVKIKSNVSSIDEWKKEAEKLEKQGKSEHAQEIRKTFFKQQQPNWKPINLEELNVLKSEALNPDRFNKKAKDKLFTYSLIYQESDNISKLSELKFRRADNVNIEYETNDVLRKFYPAYKNDNVKQIRQLIEKYGANYRDEFNLTPLMAAINFRSPKTLEFLLEQGANINEIDNKGKNALRYAISLGYDNKLQDNISHLVFKHFSYDTLRLKIDDKLIVVPSRKFEYILVNFFLAILPQVMKSHFNSVKPFFHRGLDAKTIENKIHNYPQNMVPAFRKKRNYISAMLAKNEIESNQPYNNKLFYRISRGIYILAPEIEILVFDRWQNVYDLMNIEKPKILDEYERADFLRKEFEAIMQNRKQQNDLNKFY
jgi:hypothetical protein